LTELQYEYTRSVLVVANKAGKAEFELVNNIVADLKADAREQLLSDGVPADLHHFAVVAECRYVGQGFELMAMRSRISWSRSSRCAWSDPPRPRR
jgi:N-methylhydantoinase A